MADHVEKYHVEFEHSYGVIPLRMHHGQWQIFLVQHQKGHWACPKGHPEKNETPLEAATRELFEETQLTIKRLIIQDPIEEKYQFFKADVLVHKTCTYYIAEVMGSVKLQKEELKNGLWLALEEAKAKVTFIEAQALLDQVSTLLHNFTTEITETTEEI